MYKPKFHNGEFRRPDLQYFIPNSEGKTILYTYIRKNACSAFKRIINDKTGGSGISGMKDFRWDRKSINFDCAIFVYRKPFERFVSAFSNKFIQRSGNRDIFENFAKLTGKDPSTATFRDFVDYAELPFKDIDAHVWPQKSHLLDIEYTHAINIDKLSEVMSKEFPSLSRYFNNKVNKSMYRSDLVDAKDLTDVPASEIDHYSTVSFEAMRGPIERRYIQDIEMLKEISNNNSSETARIATPIP
ncbi:sulfotransferase family 2 domain-containing protein [Paracoccus seriniphilus]|nr:sulfotransferase family 2 domain-containing protein [Paracoccus seriniphilus]WCR15567.1 sulfotransferase family 2 domain-containing protein [Paracoccus seriniphilus]